MIVLILLSIIPIYSTIKSKNLLNPSFLMTTFWILIYSFYVFFCNEILGVLDYITVFYIDIGILFFQIGSVVFVQNSKNNYKLFKIRNKRVKILTNINILCTIMLLYKIYIGSQKYFFYLPTWRAMKMFLGYKAETLGIYQYIMLYVVTVSLTMVILKIKGEKIKFKYALINFLLALLLELSYGKRIPIISMILTITFAKLILYKITKKNIITILMKILLIFVFSMLLFYLFNKIKKDNQGTFLNEIIPYFGVTLKNLDTIIKNKLYDNNYFFINILTPLYKVFNFEINSLIKIDYFNYGKYTGNTYTIYYYALQDLGQFGPIIYQFIYGLFFSYVFLKRNKSDFYFVLYCIFIEIIFLQYATDPILKALSMRIQQIIYIKFCVDFVSFKKRKRLNYEK